MSTYIWCEIVCEECSDTVAGQFTTGAIPRRAMRKEAIKAGFILSGNHAFCSLRCESKWRENNAIQK